MTRRRPRYRRNQQSLDLLHRVERATERVQEAEQLSDETHITEDNVTGTLRITDGVAYLNDRALGSITEVRNESDIGDTITTGTISAERIQVNPESERIAEHLEELRTFPYRPYFATGLDSIQVGGRLSQPNLNLEASSIADAWVNAPIRGLSADDIYFAEPASPNWQEDMEREYRELYASRDRERTARLEEELAELGRNAEPAIQTEPLRTDVPAQLPNTESAIGGPLGGLLFSENSVGRTGGQIRIDQDGIAIPRPLTFTNSNEEDARRLAHDLHTTMRDLPRYGDYSTGTIRSRKTYTFDEEKVNTLMDTIRVVQAIMSKYTFSEEDIKKLNIEDLMRER